MQPHVLVSDTGHQIQCEMLVYIGYINILKSKLIIYLLMNLMG